MDSSPWFVCVRATCFTSENPLGTEPWFEMIPPRGLHVFSEFGSQYLIDGVGKTNYSALYAILIVDLIIHIKKTPKNTKACLIISKVYNAPLTPIPTSLYFLRNTYLETSTWTVCGYEHESAKMTQFQVEKLMTTRNTNPRTTRLTGGERRQILDLGVPP